METLFGARNWNWNYLNRFGSVVILLFILCFTIQLSLTLLRSMVYLLLASRFFNKIKFMRVNGVVLYGDTWATSLQSLARYFLHGHLSCIEGEKQDWSTTTNLLPEDILVEILARLPVKSLLRFRLVSKCWRDMVKEPSFITNHHLTQVALNNGNCVLTRARVPEKREMEFALLKEDEYHVAELPFSFEPYFGGLDELYDAIYLVAGPCNGISSSLMRVMNCFYGTLPLENIRLSLLRHCPLHGRTNCVVTVLMWDSVSIPLQKIIRLLGYDTFGQIVEIFL